MAEAMNKQAKIESTTPVEAKAKPAPAVEEKPKFSYSELIAKAIQHSKELMAHPSTPAPEKTESIAETHQEPITPA